jgi:DNA-binding transcriptional MocR family regulator
MSLPGAPSQATSSAGSPGTSPATSPVAGAGVVAGVVGEIHDRSARGIAAGISRLVTRGELAPGVRLPTVRELAHQLGTSPTTVSEAWQQLARVGVIESRGRSGTFVAGQVRSGGPRRYRRMTERAGHYRLDLSTGTPDAGLLPDLGPALARLQGSHLTTSYLDHPVLPELEAVLRQRLPFAPEALTVVDGALDAIDRVATATLRLGDRVLIENPAFPPVIDLLELLGAEVVPLALDGEGIRPDSLARALEVDPVALFLQPRAHNPTGSSMSIDRATELATLLRPHQVLVVEDDHSGDISSTPDVSLGRGLGDRTVHITSFSKSHGPDLRLASVAGPLEVIGPLVDRRTLGAGWSSRLLQGVLTDLLTDPTAVAQVARARGEYAARRRGVCAALDRRGLRYDGTDGINLWVETPDEQATLVTLASLGVAAAPGSPFLVAPEPSDHVRFTVGLVSDGYDELADDIARAVPGRHVARHGPHRNGR